VDECSKKFFGWVGLATRNNLLQFGTNPDHDPDPGFHFFKLRDKAFSNFCTFLAEVCALMSALLVLHGFV